MRPVSSAELCHNVPQVNFNRFLCNEQVLTYFAIVLTGRYVFQHLDLTGRDAIFPHVLHHSRGQLRLYSLLAGVHVANGLDQFVGRQALEEIAAGAGLKSALDLDIAVERRKYNYARIWKLSADFGRGVDSTQTGQTEVHERNVRPMLAVQLNRIKTARCVSYQFHVRLTADDRSDAFANEVMIVDTQNLNSALLTHRFSLTRVASMRRPSFASRLADAGTVEDNDLTIESLRKSLVIDLHVASCLAEIKAIHHPGRGPRGYRSVE
jgi:hypothetical protein